MRTFETDVQLLKYNVLKEVAIRAFDGNLMESYYEIPKIISPGPKATMRCCIYKERAVARSACASPWGGDRPQPECLRSFRLRATMPGRALYGFGIVPRLYFPALH